MIHTLCVHRLVTSREYFSIWKLNGTNWNAMNSIHKFVKLMSYWPGAGFGILKLQCNPSGNNMLLNRKESRLCELLFFIIIPENRTRRTRNEMYESDLDFLVRINDFCLVAPIPFPIVWYLINSFFHSPNYRIRIHSKIHFLFIFFLLFFCFCFLIPWILFCCFCCYCSILSCFDALLHVQNIRNM